MRPGRKPGLGKKQEERKAPLWKERTLLMNQMPAPGRNWKKIQRGRPRTPVMSRIPKRMGALQKSRVPRKKIRKTSRKTKGNLVRKVT
jgi:hypothetical protein